MSPLGSSAPPASAEVLSARCDRRRRRGPGTGVPAGQKPVDYIRTSHGDSTFVAAVITPSFRSTEFCLAELGAVWLAADKDFFPLCVPAVERGELRATLTGIQVERIDEREALAALLARIAKHFQRDYNAAACDNAITVFLAGLDARLASLAEPAVVPAVDLEAEKAKNTALGAELTKLRDQVAAERGRGDAILAAKTAEEAVAVSLPDDDRERIDALIKEARSAVRRVKGAVSMVLPFYLRGEEMPWPDAGEYAHQEVVRAVEDGLLLDGGEGRTVLLNIDWPLVEARRGCM